MLCHLLYCRDYRTPRDIDRFFQGASISHDPFLLPDMREVVERILGARDRGERVAIYGDFDCDGITSTAILEATLRGLGLKPIVHIPERSDGHGLNAAALDALSQQHVTLIITADCGITATEEVRMARDLGMEVIVTDHHPPRSDGTLPESLAINPMRQDSHYPWRFLCGAGVTYKLAQAIEQSVSDALPSDDLLDLVALGTIADVVSLRDENRSLVIQGLERLRETRRPGLRALFDVAGIDCRLIDQTSVGFYLAPRVNAANRLATPTQAYELITATDPRAAANLAQGLNSLNTERQRLVEEKATEVIEEFGEPVSLIEDFRTGVRAPVVVTAGDWPAGISGLLASKLVDAYGVPAFVGSSSDSHTISVSARSIRAVRVDELLDVVHARCPDIFLAYGGHAGAAGFRIQRHRWTEVVEQLEMAAREGIPRDRVGTVLEIDAEVTLGQLSVTAATLVRDIAPFGPDFPEPLFLARNVVLHRTSVTKGKHAQIAFRSGATIIDGMMFNADEAFTEIPTGARLDVVFHFQLDQRLDTVKPKIQLRDWRLAA